MSQSSELLDLFRSHGNRLTLGEILQHPIGYEWRARATELRREGYSITLIRADNKVRSNNLYELKEKDLGGGGVDRHALQVGVRREEIANPTQPIESEEGAPTSGKSLPPPILSSPKVFFEDGQGVLNLGI